MMNIDCFEYLVYCLLCLFEKNVFLVPVILSEGNGPIFYTLILKDEHVNQWFIVVVALTCKAEKRVVVYLIFKL